MTVFSHVKGVTLTDLQEAEKTIKTMKPDNKGREKTEEEEKEKEKEAKQKKAEEGVRAICHSYRPVCCCSYITSRDMTRRGLTVLTGSELEVSYCQSAEV